MTYDELVEEWTKDSVIDIENLEHTSINTPLLHAKYLDLWMREKGLSIMKKLELDTLKAWKKDYYLGLIPHDELIAKGVPVYPRTIIKSEVGGIVDVDADVVKKTIELTKIQIREEFLKHCVSSISQRSYTIKSAIEYIKFKNGC